MSEQAEKPRATEEIRVSGHNLIEKVKELIKEGNVRQLRIHAEDGDFSLEMPVTIGVLAGGVVTLAAPWLAVLGVIAALISQVKIEVERDEDDDAKPQHGGT